MRNDREPLVNIDSDPRQADWAKRTWDGLPNTPEALRELLKQSRMTIEQFKRLPIYMQNIDKIPWLGDL